MAPSSSSSASSASRGRGKGFALVAAVYLLGLFIGALDTGIVTPARTVIQSDLGIGEQMGRVDHHHLYACLRAPFR